MQNREPIKSVRIAFEIVENLSQSGGVSARTLAEDLEMPRPTVHDYLRTLCEEGYLINDGGKYHISYRFLEIGGKKRSHSELYQTARPKLRDLAHSSGGHTNLVVEEQGLGVVLTTMSGENTLSALTHDGTYFYLHATAAGKAMLANYPRDRVDSILDRRGLNSLTDQTITDRDKLREDLKDTRERGYSTDSEEIVKGMRGIGTPIFDQSTGSVIGAVSVYIPVKLSKWGDLAENLLEVANIIEVDLNGND